MKPTYRVSKLLFFRPQGISAIEYQEFRTDPDPTKICLFNFETKKYYFMAFLTWFRHLMTL